MIRCLCSLGDKHSLKRAFAALVYVVERKGELVEAGSVRVVLENLNAAGSAAEPHVSVHHCLQGHDLVITLINPVWMSGV
uniref:At1g68980-like TPR repeats domain-containing protein n=1 Tax=Kalanchoe fedtschenkoi TaxID=63787 RepID=A0A7N1A3K8_KALFE